MLQENDMPTNTEVTITEKTRISGTVQNLIAIIGGFLLLIGTCIAQYDSFKDSFDAIKEMNRVNSRDIELTKQKQELDQKANELRFQQAERRLDKLEK